MSVEQDIDMTRSLIGQRIKWMNWSNQSGLFEVDRIEVVERRVFRASERDETWVVVRGWNVKSDGTIGKQRKSVSLELADVPQVDLHQLIEHELQQIEAEQQRRQRRIDAMRAELYGEAS